MFHYLFLRLSTVVLMIQKKIPELILALITLQNAEKIESIEGVFKEEMHFKDLNFRAL